MKRFLLILSLFFLIGPSLHAQDEDEKNDKIKEKMTEFIQRRLNLSRNEAEKFSPVFFRYFREWRSTLREFKGVDDKLRLQQRIVEIRLRYRSEFKEIIGEKRSNEVYEQQERFIQGIREMRKEQLIDGRSNRRIRAIIQ
jgi:hypothetical protein